MGGRHFTSHGEMKDDVKARLNGLAEKAYDASIQRLVIGCDKCKNFHIRTVQLHNGKVLFIRQLMH